MGEQEKKWDFDEYSWLENYDERMRGLERLRYDETLSEVVRISGAKPGDLILDIATGTGNLAVKFLERGCQVIGLDPSAKLLKMAEQKAAKWGGHFQIQLCKNPFLEVPFPKQTFNAIASTYSIHHITDDAKRLSVREMKRVLKPNGWVIMGDVMFKDAADKSRALAEYPDMEDEYQPTLDTFPDMFEDEGFTVEIEQMADTVWIVCAKLGREKQSMTLLGQSNQTEFLHDLPFLDFFDSLREICDLCLDNLFSLLGAFANLLHLLFLIYCSKRLNGKGFLHFEPLECQHPSGSLIKFLWQKKPSRLDVGQEQEFLSRWVVA